MFILSHWDCICGVAHSARFEVSSAQAESGTGPSPTRVNANAKISDLRTEPQSNTRLSECCINTVFAFSGTKAVMLVTSPPNSSHFENDKWTVEMLL